MHISIIIKHFIDFMNNLFKGEYKEYYFIGTIRICCRERRD